MTENAPERIWVGFNDDDDFPRGWGTPICGKEMFWETPEMSAPDDREGLVEFVRKDLAALAVKPLEWYPSPDDDTDFCADALGVTYVVDCDLDGLCSWGFFRKVGREEFDGDWSIDDAKAAAQADYEQRILSALENNT